MRVGFVKGCTHVGILQATAFHPKHNITQKKLFYLFFSLTSPTSKKVKTHHDFRTLICLCCWNSFFLLYCSIHLDLWTKVSQEHFGCFLETKRTCARLSDAVFSQKEWKLQRIRTWSFSVVQKDKHLQWEPSKAWFLFKMLAAVLPSFSPSFIDHSSLTLPTPPPPSLPLPSCLTPSPKCPNTKSKKLFSL